MPKVLMHTLNKQPGFRICFACNGESIFNEILKIINRHDMSELSTRVMSNFPESIRKKT